MDQENNKSGCLGQLAYAMGLGPLVTAAAYVGVSLAFAFINYSDSQTSERPAISQPVEDENIPDQERLTRPDIGERVLEE